MVFEAGDSNRYDMQCGMVKKSNYSDRKVMCASSRVHGDVTEIT